MGPTGLPDDGCVQPGEGEGRAVPPAASPPRALFDYQMEKRDRQLMEAKTRAAECGTAIYSPVDYWKAMHEVPKQKH